MSAYRCTCGYAAASDGELGDHWGAAFIPADDRDRAGVLHAEAARDDAARCAALSTSGGASEAGVSPNEASGGASDTAARLRCLCGDAFDAAARLDDHLLSAFIPADRAGLDGRVHALAT